MPPVLAKPTNQPQPNMAAQQPQGMEQDDEPNVTPEEQALYDDFVHNAMNVMYSEATSREVLNTIQTAETTVEGIAQAAILVGDQVYQKAVEQNVTIPDAVLGHAGDQIIDAIIEMAQAANVIQDISDNDRFIIQTRVEGLWRENHPEMVDQEQEQQDFNNISPDQMKQIIGQMGA